MIVRILLTDLREDQLRRAEALDMSRSVHDPSQPFQIRCVDDDGPAFSADTLGGVVALVDYIDGPKP